MLLWSCSIRCKNTELIILARAKHREMIEMEWMKVWSERLLWGCLAHGSAIGVVVNSKKCSVSECGTPASSHLLRRGFFLSLYLELHLHTRAAKNFGRFWSQTPPLSLAQNVNPYQFLGPYGIVLPRHESFEVGHFKASIEIKWPTLKLSWRGKTMP